MADKSIPEKSVKDRLKEIQEQMENKNRVSKPKPTDCHEFMPRRSKAAVKARNVIIRENLTLLTATELLERAAEEIENIYGGETELTEAIREFMEFIS